MSEKLLQAILDELISLNKKVGNIEEVVEIISGKMNESEEQLDKMINSFQAINKNIDGVRDDITDLEKKVIYNVPNMAGLEYAVENIDFKGMAENLKKIAKSTA